MGVYVIGQVNNKYDRLQYFLDKINFNKDNDSLCFLGNALPLNTDGLELLKFICDNKEVCMLAKGTNEEKFLKFINNLQPAMANEQVHNAMIKATKTYVSIFEQIAPAFALNLRHKDHDAFYHDQTIAKWYMGAVNQNMRERTLEAMISLAEAVDYDIAAYEKLHCLLMPMDRVEGMRGLLISAVALTIDQFNECRAYLQQLENEFAFQFASKRYILSFKALPQGLFDSKGAYYISGYDTRKTIAPFTDMLASGSDIRFPIREDQIFSYVDIKHNRHIYMGLPQDQLTVLKLDDMTQYYIEAQEADEEYVMITVPAKAKKTFSYSDDVIFGNIRLHKPAILTFDQGAYEYVIAASSNYSHLFYLPVGEMFNGKVQVIQNSKDIRDTRQIIQLVSRDHHRRNIA